MEDYITLVELYIYHSKLFKTKNLKGFIRTNKIQENDVVKLKAGKIGIKKTWIKKNIPSFNLKLREMKEEEEKDYFEVQSTLEKYGCKTFNPVNFNLDSTMVKFFLKEENYGEIQLKRKPYFTRKGLLKIMVFFNAVPENIFTWMHELSNGCMQSQVDNLNNILEMVNLNHTPIIKNVNGDMAISNHIYNINKEDIVVDFKRVADLKKESNLKMVVEEYRCPIYSQLQTDFNRSLEEAETRYNNKLKELKQEKVIQHLQQELDKEKSLKDQVLSLTQSFIPVRGPSPYSRDEPLYGEMKPSPSPIKSLGKVGSLKPSKIQ